MTHLLRETSLEDLARGERVCVELARLSGIRYRYIVVPERMCGDPGLETATEELFHVTPQLREEWLD